MINIMILYNISIHTLFHSDSFKLCVCMPVCLFICQSVWMYVWVHLRRAAAHLSKEYNHTIGSTVRGHDSKSYLNLYYYFFFCLAQSSKRWLLFETWLPFLQESVKRSLLSSSLIFSHLCLPSTLSPPSLLPQLPLFCLSLTVKGW